MNYNREELNLELQHWGWNQCWEQQFSAFNDEGFSVGRVITEHRNRYKVVTHKGELHAEVSGRIKHEGIVLERRDLFPAVGDWVVINIVEGERKAIIHDLLPRTSKLSRKVAGKKVYEQIVAANIDLVFLLSSLNAEFNERRLERALVLAWESGAQPIIVLTKADICRNAEQVIMAAHGIAGGVPVHVVSAINHNGLSDLMQYTQPGKTIALLGSSGVGKSTLINCFMGENVQRVSEIREDDDKGRHTTTHRQLRLLPNGGLIIDTPGMRELQIWEADDGLNQAYQDIEELAQHCYFKDCLHRDEPKCAVKEAVHNGRLDPKRFESYKKLQNEVADFSLKRAGNVRAVAKEKGATYAQLLEYTKKRRGRRTLK